MIFLLLEIQFAQLNFDRTFSPPLNDTGALPTHRTRAAPTTGPPLCSADVFVSP